MATGEFLGRFDDRRLAAEHLPRLRVFLRGQFQRSARGLERVNRVDVGQPLRVAQVQHVQLTLRQRPRLGFRLRMGLVEVGEHLNLSLPIGEVGNGETDPPFVLDLVDFDDDGAVFDFEREVGFSPFHGPKVLGIC